MQKCKVCGKNTHSDFCVRHKPRNIKNKNKNTDDSTNDMILFFNQIWAKRKHYSEVSGKFLGHTNSTLFHHHILPKSKYKDLAFVEDNIILLTPEEHATVELNMYKYPIINEKREKLKEKYNIV